MGGGVVVLVLTHKQQHLSGSLGVAAGFFVTRLIPSFSLIGFGKYPYLSMILTIFIWYVIWFLNTETLFLTSALDIEGSAWPESFGECVYSRRGGKDANQRPQ